MKRLMKNVLQELKPYDFILLIVSAIVGFVISLFGDTNITCICSTIIVVLFMLFWLLYNISENNADYMRMIDREFRNEHWYEVFYLALPICSTLRRMGKYEQSVKVAEAIRTVLTKINKQKIDLDWIDVKYSSIEKIEERLMTNDLGYSYFILKDMENAKKHIRTGIGIARNEQIPYAELKGWSMLLQMLLIDNYDAFFSKEEVNEIYDNFRTIFDKYWGYLGNEFPTPELSDYISYLKSIEIEVMYKYRRLGTMSKQEFLEMMEKIASGYENKRLNDKYYDCMKNIFEIKLSDAALDFDGNAETTFVSIIDGAFEANIGLTPVQYIKYVTIYLEYYTRTKATEDKKRKGKRDAKISRERVNKYIKKVEKELWYVEDPCIDRFNNMKKACLKAMK